MKTGRFHHGGPRWLPSTKCFYAAMSLQNQMTGNRRVFQCSFFYPAYLDFLFGERTLGGNWDQMTSPLFFLVALYTVKVGPQYKKKVSLKVLRVRTPTDTTGYLDWNPIHAIWLTAAPHHIHTHWCNKRCVGFIWAAINHFIYNISGLFLTEKD